MQYLSIFILLSDSKAVCLEAFETNNFLTKLCLDLSAAVCGLCTHSYADDAGLSEDGLGQFIEAGVRVVIERL